MTEPKSLSSVYAPFGRLISCETVITVDSTSIQTPIMGLVTEDVYHRGKLVIPAGTRVTVFEIEGATALVYPREPS